MNPYKYLIEKVDENFKVIKRNMKINYDFDLIFMIIEIFERLSNNLD
jgi:hypothetical protein